MSKSSELVTAEEEKKQYIAVRIGDEVYGIPISYVDNIVRMEKITRVPKAPAHYVGVINIRGEVVPVMSIRRKMGLEEDVYTKATRIIILKLEAQGTVGVVVDEVREVVSLGESDIERNVQTMKKASGNFINGIGKNGDQLISLFDISRVVDEVQTA